MYDRVALIMEHSENRSLVQRSFDSKHDVFTASDQPVLEVDADLFIFDWPAFQRRKKKLRRVLDGNGSVFHPVVLLVRESELSRARKHLNGPVDDLLKIPLPQELLHTRIDNLLTQHQLSVEMNNFNETLQNRVEQKTKEIRNREEDIIVRLASASKHRDEETGGHIRRMGLYAEIMAEELGWDAERCRNIRLAAMMHDVGKVGIPDNVLQKPGDLTDEEFETMKQHSVIGAEILENSNIELLQLAARIAQHHHEQWDGSGYPEGLAEEAIPVEARLVAVIDVYDALVHDRVYRDAMPESKVLDIIREDTGSHFDPEMAECFFEVLPSIRAIRQLNPEELDDAIQA